MISSDTIHIDGLLRHTAKKIAAANNNTNLAAQRMRIRNFLSNFVDEHCINAEAAACSQGLSGDLQKDSFVHVRSKYRMRSLLVAPVAIETSAPGKRPEYQAMDMRHLWDRLRRKWQVTLFAEFP